MPSGPPPTDRPAPTKLAALPELLAYAQSLGVDRHRWRAKRGVSARALALLWLVLAWRGSGRPDPLDQRDAPLRAALLGLARLPCARPLRRSLPRLPAKRVRAAVAAAYLPELPRRAGRVGVALDAHQVPDGGCGTLARVPQGWSGSHRRRLRGDRLSLAVVTQPGPVVTYLLARLARRGGRRRVHPPGVGRRPARHGRPRYPGLRPRRAAPRPPGRALRPAAPRAAPRRRHRRRRLRRGRAAAPGRHPRAATRRARPPTSGARGPTSPAGAPGAPPPAPAPTAGAGGSSRPSRSRSTATTSTTW